MTHDGDSLFSFTSAPRCSSSVRMGSLSATLAAIMRAVHPLPSCPAVQHVPVSASASVFSSCRRCRELFSRGGDAGGNTHLDIGIKPGQFGEHEHNLEAVGRRGPVDGVPPIVILLLGELGVVLGDDG